jgi:hypothetical protein
LSFLRKQESIASFLQILRMPEQWIPAFAGMTEKSAKE